jgi:hypothetical protein
VLFGSFTPSNPGIDVTVLRVVGGVSVQSDQSSSAEEQIGAFGLILITDVALAAGIASIPGPVTDVTDDGWFCYQSFAISGAQGTVPNNTTWFPFNTKGKRIVSGEGISIAIVVENIHASHGLEILMTFRMLSQIRGTR